ncbi:hypothetical protein [Candidatus Methylacidiphilum infernorum]|uniref:hypothetical protein n=1 Tax=Candidatus Methylacidiphilum infernorum TaxID=511746 RepID=UPI000302BB93|nr:hypothetical protein [Candidatus Methylacidiphilum infernorum]
MLTGIAVLSRLWPWVQDEREKRCEGIEEGSEAVQLSAFSMHPQEASGGELDEINGAEPCSNQFLDEIPGKEQGDLFEIARNNRISGL